MVGADLRDGTVAAAAGALAGALAVAAAVVAASNVMCNGMMEMNFDLFKGLFLRRARLDSQPQRTERGPEDLLAGINGK
ncbi:unnamed protein product [Arctogadus glacialis]